MRDGERSAWASVTIREPFKDQNQRRTFWLCDAELRMERTAALASLAMTFFVTFELTPALPASFALALAPALARARSRSERGSFRCCLMRSPSSSVRPRRARLVGTKRSIEPSSKIDGRLLLLRDTNLRQSLGGQRTEFTLRGHYQGEQGGAAGRAQLTRCERSVWC